MAKLDRIFPLLLQLSEKNKLDIDGLFITNLHSLQHSDFGPNAT